MIYTANVPHHVDNEQLERSHKIADTFLTLLPSACDIEAEFILLVVDAERQHIYGEIDNERYNSSYFHKIRTYFISEARSKGFEVIDLDPIFRHDFKTHGVRFEFPTDGHWNSHGHEKIYTEITKANFLHNLLKIPADGTSKVLVD